MGRAPGLTNDLAAVPELPEVETVRRLIRPDVIERTITSTRVHWPRSLGGTSAAAFSKAVRGARVADVRRRGKFIVFDLMRAGAPQGVLLCHLRMTGRLHVERPSKGKKAGGGESSDDYVRVRLGLDDGRELRFVDVRKFGRFLFRRDPSDMLASLGPEPLSDGFTSELFLAGLHARRRALKPLLLDQSFLAGLGNIYVDESLHLAGLHPLVTSDRVSAKKARVLHTVIRQVLLEAIEREGSSFDTFYRTPEGQPGSYQHQFQVYGRGGRPCRTCERPIRRIVVGQRGTHFCTRCQPPPRIRRTKSV